MMETETNNKKTNEVKSRQSSKYLVTAVVAFTRNMSDKHKDLRVSSLARGSNDHETFVKWLHAHSPFAYLIP